MPLTQDESTALELERIVDMLDTAERRASPVMARWVRRAREYVRNCAIIAAPDLVRAEPERLRHG